MGRLAEAIMREWGFDTFAEIPPYAEALTTTPEQILKNNPDRLSWDIFNLGDEVVFLGHDNTVSSSNGYYLSPKGGHIGMMWKEDGELVGREIWAVAAVSASTIFIKAVAGK
ncbi:hypothetical protein ES708_25445 [subsurface metagenome]